jgi:hypothetical protein
VAADQNPYLQDAADYVNGAMPAQAMAIRQNLVAAANTNPDTEARNQQLAASTATPLETVRNMADTIRAQAAGQQVDAQGIVQNYPATAALLQDPDKTRLVHDDIPATTAVEQAARTAAGQRGLLEDAWVGLKNTALKIGGYYSKLLANFAGEGGTPYEQGGYTDVGTQLQRSAAQPQNAPQRWTGNVTSGLAYAAFGGGAPLMMAGTEQSATYQQLRDQGVDENTALHVSSALGAIQGATAALPMGEVAGTGLRQIAGSVAKAGTKAAGVGALQSVASDTAAYQILKSQGYNAQAEQYRPSLEKAGNAAVFMAALHLGMQTATGLPGLRTQDVGAAAQAEQGAASLQRLVQTANASKLRARNPQAFHDLVEQATQDGPVSDVWIDAKKFDETLAQSGVTRADVERTMPAVADQLDDALATGGDVRIPLADFATHIAGSGLEDQLLSELRTAPDAMTLTEAREFQGNAERLMQEQADKIAQTHQQLSDLETSGESVRQAIRDQLDGAKRFTPQVNDAYATMMANFYLTQAGRHGLTPEEMYQRYPVHIGAENPAGEALAQDGEPHASISGQEFGAADAPVGDLRKAAKQWYDSTLRGTTVTNEASGRDVVFSNGKKAFSASANPEKVRLFAALPDLIRRGTIKRSEAPIDPSAEKAVKAYHWLEGDVRVGDRVVHAGVTLREDDKGTLYYNHNPVEMEGPPASEARAAPAHKAGGLPSEGEALGQSLAPDGLNLHVLGQGAAQRGFFDPLTKTLGLLKNADLSTFIHESGHFYLDTLAHMAAQDDAPAEIKADMAKVLDWMGVKGTPEQSALDRWHSMSLDEQREAHEKFARGFEAYVMEGKAPSLELRGVFQRFRAWLLNVYKSLSALKVDLSDDVRGVMDRLLASNDAIRSAEQARAFEPMFKTPEEAQKFGVDAGDYHRLAEQATQTAIEQLQTKGVRDMAWLGRARDRALKALNKQAAEARRVVENEVKGEVYQQPVYQAWQWLTGKLPAEGEEVTAGRLNLTDLEHRMGAPDAVTDAQVSRLRELGMVAKKTSEGLHPDLVADMFGFGSGRELVRALTSAEHPKLVIEGMTDQRMLERHGELSSPDAIERAADEAVHNEARARFIATELAAIDKANTVRADTGRKTATGRAITVDALARAARQVAEDTIARTKIRDVVPTRFTAAETRAARDAERALAKGDTEGAAIAKRAQMLNNRLAKTAMDATDEVAAGLKYLRRFDKAATRDAIGADYAAQVDALLERFDLRQGTPLNAAERRQSLLEWVQAQRDKGLDPAVPDKLLDEAQRMPYREMSMEDFRGLLDSVKSIEHLGRLKNKLLDLKEQRDLDALVNEALTTLKDLPQREAAEPRNPGVGGKGLDKVNAKYLQGASLLRSADASLLKMEQLFDWLDAHNPHGVFNRVVFRRIAEAQGVESDLLKDVTGRLRALHEALPKDAQRDLLERYTVPELVDSKTGKPSSLLKKEILAIALNTGNESNFGKLLEGEGWSERGVWTALNRHMTKGDWDFVQGVWDTLDSLWPRIAAMEKRLSGVEPPRVEARPITTPHGEYRGGYYPVIYDPLRAHDVDMRNERSGAALFENTFSRPATARGHTKARVDYARPLYLSMDVLPRHLSQVVHDLAYREAIIDADKLLSDSRIRQGIEDTLGREYYKQVRPWLQAIANDKVYDERGLAFWDKAAHWARTTTTLVGLGFRATTMMIHGATAASNSVGEIGGRWFLSGAKAFIGSPERMRDARDFVFERSAEMRNRMNEVDRDVRDALREMDLHATDGAEGAAARVVDPVKRFAYYGISMLDMASALPTWLGAYNRALHEGRSEDQAIYEADKAVRNAHGGGGTKDLAAIQRGQEWQKLFTMFYSFWNHFYNRQRDIARTAAGIPEQVRQGDYAGARRDFAMVLARSWFYFIIPQLLHAALKPPAPGSQNEDQHWLSWAAEEIAMGMFSGIPVVRDVASSIGTGRDYTPTPAAQVVTTIGKTAKDVKSAAAGDPVSDKWLKHATQTAGYVFGLPLGQASTSAQFLWDVHNGAEAPDGVADWWRGLIYGHAKPKN